MESELIGLNNSQKSILNQWYDRNFDVLDEFSFECETDLEEDILLKIYELNYFKTINLAINDFILNVLARGI